MSDDLKAYEVLERAIENEKALLRDRMIYGTSFVDEEGKRIDPKTLEPWRSMDIIESRTSWFSFGYNHRHEIDGRRFDRNVIAKITAPDPRAVMVAVFGQKWAFEYAEPPDHHLMRDLPVIEVSLEMTDA